MQFFEIHYYTKSIVILYVYTVLLSLKALCTCKSDITGVDLEVIEMH